MSITLLTAVQRVNRNVGLDPTITALSNQDESNDIVQYLNEAYEDLLMMLPPDCPFLNANGTFTTVAGTRLYPLAAEAFSPDIYTWSFEDETDLSQLQFVTKDYVYTISNQWDTYQSKPQWLYLEGTNQVGMYPVPNGAYVINYQYAQSTSLTRLSATTDTFILPDRWIRFVEKRAQEKYERNKAFDSADATYQDAENLLAQIITESWEMNPTYLFNEAY